MLENNIPTALILEDDVDFSVGIREILSGISTHLQPLTGAATPDNYGLDVPENEESWDVLSLGHCWNEPPPKHRLPNVANKVQAWEDMYAPEKDSYINLLPPGSPGHGSHRVRVIRPTWVVVCTQGYVVSLEGAKRLLYYIGGPGGTLNEALDLAMMNKFMDGKLRGYTVVPTVFGQYKYGDWRDTDIQNLPEEGEGEKGSGGDIVRGVREEMAKVMGGRNIWKEHAADGDQSVGKRMA